MVNRPRIKGTRFESAIVACLRASGWPHAERRSLNSALDRGDIAGLVGVCIEAKAHATLAIPAWLRELDKEIANSGADTGAVWAKARGKARAEDGFIIMRPLVYLALLKAAGY